MEDLIDDYVEKITSLDEYQRMLELKNIINTKYANLIIGFKTKESLYLDALQNKAYYKDFNKIQLDFKTAKENLYSKEEVKEYLALENKINVYLNDDFNELKKSISNKFKLNKIINLE